MRMDLDEALDTLYAASPEEFVRTRTALAKQLKADGRTDDAAAIAAVRKPPLAAWALNQLSRRNRREVDLLLDAGHRLREAQAAVLRGAQRDVFERARSDQTKALARLLEEAEKLLEDRGTASPPVLGQIRESLEAAAVSDDGRTLLARGRFTGPISRSGFELVGELAAGAPRAPRPAQHAGRRRRAQQALREARARLRDAERAARKAWLAADKLRSDADAASRTAEEAGAARDRVAAEVEELEAQLRGGR
jgi:hypothetical protein